MLVLCYVLCDIYQFIDFTAFVCHDMNQWIIDNYDDDVFDSLCKDNWSVSLNL